MSNAAKKITRKIRVCANIYLKSKKHGAVLWRQVDEFLEDMCGKFPTHTNLNEIVLKVTAIDRLYHAMLYRRRKDYHKIALGLMNSDIDVILKKLEGSLNLKKLSKVMEAAEIVAGFGNPKRAKYWVFASKYLHFHKRKLFPLYDNNAKKKCRATCRRLGLGKEDRYEKNQYKAFCSQLIAIQKKLEQETGYKPSLSDLDKFLYGERYLKSL
jgi:hypothetical protein